MRPSCPDRGLSPADHAGIGLLCLDGIGRLPNRVDRNCTQILKAAIAAFPEEIADGVYFCGFASRHSYGATSYLIVRPGGNVLVDSPRFSVPLAKRLEEMGGVRWMVLTHRDSDDCCLATG